MPATGCTGARTPAGTCAMGAAWTTRGRRSSSSPTISSGLNVAPSNALPSRAMRRRDSRRREACSPRETPRRRAHNCGSSGGSRSHRGPLQGSPGVVAGSLARRVGNGSPGGAMRPGDARAPLVPPVNLVLVGCGAVARCYYAPTLTRLLASGWVGAVRLFDPTSARARRSPRCCRRARSHRAGRTC